MGKVQNWGIERQGEITRDKRVKQKQGIPEVGKEIEE